MALFLVRKALICEFRYLLHVVSAMPIFFQEVAFAFVLFVGFSSPFRPVFIVNISKSG